MAYALSTRSLSALVGVHPGLVRVVHRAIELSDCDFVVTEGLRTTERQAKLLAAGASRTMNSTHIKQPDGFGHAVDLAALVDGDVRWDWPLYGRLAAAMKAAALECGVPIVWGGDWRTFKDGPHFQLGKP